MSIKDMVHTAQVNIEDLLYKAHAQGYKQGEADMIKKYERHNQQNQGPQPATDKTPDETKGRPTDREIFEHQVANHRKECGNTDCPTRNESVEDLYQRFQDEMKQKFGMGVIVIEL